MGVTVHHGDSREVLKSLADCSIDSCCTDPPYALVSIVKRFGKPGAAPCKTGNGKNATGAYARASRGFMGQTWDNGETAFDPAFWREVYRVLKPGAHVLAMGGTRTNHRLACAVEDAGFEIRDSILNLVAADVAAAAFLASLNDEQRAAFCKCLDDSQLGGLLAWVFGAGFPKSHDVPTAVEKTLCTARKAGDRVEWFYADDGSPMRDKPPFRHPQANHFVGFGTAIKPAMELIVMARKPLDGTVAANVLKHGTGALNIDGCRIGDGGGTRKERSDDKSVTDSVGGYLNAKAGEQVDGLGRWPANVVHDGSEDVLAGFPQSDGQRQPITSEDERKEKSAVNVYGDYGPRGAFPFRGDSGSAARFFYCAKADKDDRLGSDHPTVKPVDLMRWLCRLVTPPGGTVLDPFAGSGSTGSACMAEGFSAVLIEREEKYVADIKRRIAHVKGEDAPLFKGAAA